MTRVATIPLVSVTVDAQKFKFSSNCGKNGSSGSLRGVRRFSKDWLKRLIPLALQRVDIPGWARGGRLNGYS